jgi:FkbM family methyltransferase
MVPKFLNHYLETKAPVNLQVLYEAHKIWRWGEREIRALTALCDSARTSIDIGANRGEFIWFLARHSRDVIAIDANPACIPELQRRHRSRAKIENVGISNLSTMLELHIPGNDPRHGRATFSSDLGKAVAGKTTLVPVKPLTEVLGPVPASQIGFIKIDVEGHEMEVLEGAYPVIANGTPNLIIEIEEHHRAGSTSHIFAKMKALGYHGWFAWRDQLCDIATFDNTRHQDYSWPDSKTTRHYNFCNNFIFSRQADMAERLRNSGMLRD